MYNPPFSLISHSTTISTDFPWKKNSGTDLSTIQHLPPERAAA
jgi:hypothetical protein